MKPAAFRAALDAAQDRLSDEIRARHEAEERAASAEGANRVLRSELAAAQQRAEVAEDRLARIEPLIEAVRESVAEYGLDSIHVEDDVKALLAETAKEGKADG